VRPGVRPGGKRRPCRRIPPHPDSPRCRNRTGLRSFTLRYSTNASYRRVIERR
jgi:hypothetical protein